MVTRPLVAGLNLVTLAGFLVMGIGLNLGRTRKVRAPVAFLLMGAGTVLVFAGIYAVQAQR